MKKVDVKIECVKPMSDSTALFLLAMEYYGTKEKIGSEHNPLILEWFHNLGHEWVDNDETPWCAAFIANMARDMGLEYSTELIARSWLNYGEPKGFPLVRLGKGFPLVRLGHVVVLWRVRPNSRYGHVGLYAGQDLHNVYLLGGNQDNRVCIKGYPRERVLGIRELKRIKHS